MLTVKEYPQWMAAFEKGIKQATEKQRIYALGLLLNIDTTATPFPASDLEELERILKNHSR